MGKEKEIVLKSQKVIKLSELTEDQKIIYDAGYYEGQQDSSLFFVSILLGCTVFGFLLYYITTVLETLK